MHVINNLPNVCPWKKIKDQSLTRSWHFLSHCVEKSLYLKKPACMTWWPHNISCTDTGDWTLAQSQPAISEIRRDISITLKSTSVLCVREVLGKLWAKFGPRQIECSRIQQNCISDVFAMQFMMHKAVTQFYQDFNIVLDLLQCKGFFSQLITANRISCLANNVCCWWNSNVMEDTFERFMKSVVKETYKVS